MLETAFRRDSYRSLLASPLFRPDAVKIAPVLAALIVVCFFSVSASAQFVGYVPNTASNSVTIFATQLTTSAAPLSNSNTDNVIQTLDSTTGWKSPVRVAVLGDTTVVGAGTTPHSTAYVTSQGDNGLWAIDTLTQLSSRSAKATNINSSSNPLKLSQPGGIAISTAIVSGASVQAAYVANQKDGTVSIINIDPSSSSQNTLIANIATTGAASSTIPEVAAEGNFVFVTENGSSPSLWYIDVTASTPQATSLTLPEGTGTLAGLNAFQLVQGNPAGTHDFVVTSDSVNGTAIVIDVTSTCCSASHIATASRTLVRGSFTTSSVALGQGSTPVGIASGYDWSVNTSTSIQAVYVADGATVSEGAIWYFNVDCSSVCTVNQQSSQIAFASATPTGIGITADGQQLFVTEASSPGFQNFCVPGSSCSSQDNSSDTTVGNGATGLTVTDISTGSAPLCWFTGTLPVTTQTAIPSSVCNDTNNCGASNSALGACAESRRIKAANVSLDFQDNFGCIPFGSNGTGTGSPCSAAGGLGGQTLYNVAGVFTTVISQTNSNGTGQVTAQTQVAADVTITTQPSSQSINPGSQANLSVVATSQNQAPISYQWYVGTSPKGSPISGATSATYQPSPSTTTSYWVQVNDTTGPVNSASAIVTVNTPPSINPQPPDQSILVGTQATLTVAASGTAPLTYQWYQGAASDTSTPVGTNNPTYVTPVETNPGTVQFWVRVTNSLGHADSRTIKITVTTTAIAPSITTQPASQTITSGQTATLTVQAGGTSLTYQWYTGNSGDTTQPISGATSFSYTTPALTVTTNYWVRVSNSAGQVDSNSATITVTAPLVASPPGSTTISAGQSLIYTITLNTGSTMDTLSCQPQPPNQSLPTGVSCLFSPSQISAGQSSTLTLATSGPTADLRHANSPGLFYALIFPVPVWGLLMVISPRKGRFLRLISPALLLLLLIGCGTNPRPVQTPPNSVTPPGVYTVIVVASNQGQVVASTPVTFTVH